MCVYEKEQGMTAVDQYLDLQQFTYSPGRSVDDTKLFILNTLCSHIFTVALFLSLYASVMNTSLI